MRLHQKYFLGVILILGIVLSIWFVMADVVQVTGVIANQNSSAVYDEGSFFINWSAATLATGYNVSIWVNSSTDSIWWALANNDSALGYAFSNTTEANYTFHVQAMNATGYGANSTNVSIYVDSTGPTVTLPVYTNGTAVKNSTTLTLNISVSDATSGVTGSGCKIDVNGTNQTIMVSGGWCNGTIGLNGVTDGNTTLDIWVNDTANALTLNNSYVVQADTTAPSPTASCSPSTVITGDSFPCSCSATDATSGVSSTSSSSTSGTTSNTAQTGTFTYTCGATDNAGNSGSATATYSVTQSPGTVGGTATPTWTTHSITESLFEQGYTRELGTKNRIKVQIGAEDHFIGVVSVSENQATIEVSSDPVQVILAAGEDAKVDVTGDGFYDVYVLLNGIINNKADVTIQKIHEEIPEGGTGVETTGEQPSEEEEEGISVWIWIVIAAMIVIIIAASLIKKKK